MKAFLDPPSEAVKRWKSLFRQTRQLSYLSLHRRAPGASYVVATREPSDDDLKQLFPVDALAESDPTARAKWEVLGAIDRHDAAELFGSTDAATEVLAHVEAFKPWWNDRRAKAQPFAERLDNLFLRPEDWQARSSGIYESFAKLRVPSRLDWASEVRLWLRDSKQQDPWDCSNFLITPDAGDALSVDIYSGDRGLSASTLRHCVVQLARAYAGNHGDAGNQSLWMSSARLIARAFEACLQPQFSIRLQPVQASPGHTGYASVGDTYEFLRGLVKIFLVACTDEDRAVELRQTLVVADRMCTGHWREPALMLLARGIVFDSEENRSVTDLDGLFGYFREETLTWVVVETKKRDSGNGERQLRENLGRCLSGQLEIHEMPGCAQDVWYTTIQSPAYLAPRARTLRSAAEDPATERSE